MGAYVYIVTIYLSMSDEEKKNQKFTQVNNKGEVKK